MVSGITHTELSSACHKYSSSPLGSCASRGSRSERNTRFPPSKTSTKSISVSVRAPVVVCGFMLESRFSLLFIPYYIISNIGPFIYTFYLSTHRQQTVLLSVETDKC